jgi:heme A synthase
MMLILLVGWGVTIVTIEFVQAGVHGYGTGFSNDGYLPKSLLQLPQVRDNPRAIRAIKTENQQAFINATNVQQGGGIFHDTWRILATLAVELLVILTWYIIASRSGTF